ncbi:hypothetical protein K3718_00580 [Leisingera aquaemixtae]|uniref:Uncharacterized protein n=1 Tax=Leisingera aquaemixtae TaxID=1396826 RepID=A0ABY5WJK2_9RHOB|nr:hypothetical protein [Leisingera aquaemixtae]UWQ41616.1 hypothetical protein K3718_00580 [Leisingera aquaemixtae]
MVPQPAGVQEGWSYFSRPAQIPGAFTRHCFGRPPDPALPEAKDALLFLDNLDEFSAYLFRSRLFLDVYAAVMTPLLKHPPDHGWPCRKVFFISPLSINNFDHLARQSQVHSFRIDRRSSSGFFCHASESRIDF